MFVVKRGRNHFENLGAHETIIKWIPDKQGVRVWIAFI